MKYSILYLGMVFGLIIIILLLSMIQSIVSQNNCKVECSSKDSLTYEIRPTGTIFDKDYCICYYPNKVEVFKLK